MMLTNTDDLPGTAVLPRDYYDIDLTQTLSLPCYKAYAYYVYLGWRPAPNLNGSQSPSRTPQGSGNNAEGIPYVPSDKAGALVFGPSTKQSQRASKTFYSL